MNLLTEADALTKWCPMSRRHFDPLAGIGLGNMPNESVNTCAASGCMAWRKQETPEFHAVALREFQATGKQLVSDTGYCGLAGEP